MTPAGSHGHNRRRMEVPMPAKKLREFLDSQGIAYTTISHAVAYAAKEIAALTHISNKELAKTVVIKIDSELAKCRN